MATKQTVIRKGLTILGNLNSGIGDFILTRDATDKSVGAINPIDPSSYLTTALTNGYIIIGNGSNLATPVLPTGAITFTNAGVTSIAADVITNNNINSAAAIAYSKLNLASQIKNADIAVAAAITRTKLATGNVNRILINDASGIFTENTAITANRVLISDANGLPIHSTTTTTTLGFLDIGSSLTTLLSNKLSFSSALTPATGDTIIYTGGVWTRLPIGTAGQLLTVTGGVPVWQASGTGITNSAANTELMVSNGTNAISSKLFVPSNGDITLGDTGLAGTARTLTASGSSANVDINIITKGTAVIRLEANAISIFDPAASGDSVIIGGHTIFSNISAGTAIQPFGITASAGNSGSVTGGNLNLTSGNGYSVGNNAPGNVNIASGVPNGGGAEGAVNIQSRSTGKLGFYNVTAVIRPTTGGGSAAL